jgi:hypothetical protein
LCLFIYTYVCTHIVLLDALQNYVQNIRIKWGNYIEYFYHN